MLIVIVITEVPPTGMLVGENVLVRTGGRLATAVRVAGAAVPVRTVTPSEATAVGADVVFNLTPAVVAFTVAVSVHVNPPMRKVPE